MATLPNGEAICTQEVTHVEEADELLDLVSQVPTRQDVQAANTAFSRFHNIVSHHHRRYPMSIRTAACSQRQNVLAV